jgi:hypothetical protein
MHHTKDIWCISLGRNPLLSTLTDELPTEPLGVCCLFALPPPQQQCVCFMFSPLPPQHSACCMLSPQPPCGCYLFAQQQQCLFHFFAAAATDHGAVPVPCSCSRRQPAAWLFLVQPPPAHRLAAAPPQCVYFMSAVCLFQCVCFMSRACQAPSWYLYGKGHGLSAGPGPFMLGLPVIPPTPLLLPSLPPSLPQTTPTLIPSTLPAHKTSTCTNRMN